MALKVELQVFDGPLDLLLNLIEKNKINIFDIPITEITDQYLEYVRKMEEADLGVMSEFMVMASELISIKCRMLLPREVDDSGEEIDPRDDLVQQLLEYKTYKYMSYELKDRMDAAGSVFKPETIPKEVSSYRPEVDPADIIGDLTLERLHQVFDQVIRRQEEKIDPVRSRFGTITKEEVSLPEKLDSVARYAKEHRHFSFRSLLSNQSSKVQVVVTFLAVLELIKYGFLMCRQDSPDDDITIDSAPDKDIEELKRQIGESED